MIAIEKKVPVPADVGRRGRLAIYPFKSMEVGDSFVMSRQESGKSSLSVLAYSIPQSSSLLRQQPDGVSIRDLEDSVIVIREGTYHRRSLRLILLSIESKAEDLECDQVEFSDVDPIEFEQLWAGRGIYKVIVQ